MKKGFVLFLVLFSSLVMLVGLWPQIAPLFAAAEPDGLDLFFQSNQLFGAGLSYDVALGDVDGDGDLDALLAKNGPNEVWLNDGTAVFTQNQQLGSDFNKGVALGDLDGDMDLDAFIANGSDGTPDRVWLNDGVGNFAVMTQTLGTYTSEKVALADVDMDDDLDAFVTACSHPLYNIFNTNVLWLNDGAGQFVDSGFDFGQVCSVGIAIDDLNHDGLPDIVVGNAGTALGVEVWLNETAVPSDTVTFSQTQLINLTYNYAIALGDMNNDTHLDIVIGNSDELGTNQPDRIFINDGTGQFTDSGHLLGNSASFGASLGDFNLDGYLDIVFANGFPNGPLQADTVWFNEAAFTFTNESLGESYANAVAVGDLDMDGSLDLLLATYQGDQVWRNRINIVYDQVAFLPVVFQE